MFRHLAAAAVVVALGAGARADDKAFNDAEFVKKAASGGMKEVAMGKLGMSMAKSADVKKFSEMIVNDHTKANKELMAAAKAAGLAVPETISADDQKHVEMIKGHTDADFDKHYIAHMVKDHEMDVAEFTKASKEAKDPAIKEFATKTLPTLQQHLEMAKKLHGSEK